MSDHDTIQRDKPEGVSLDTAPLRAMFEKLKAETQNFDALAEKSLSGRS